MAIVYRHRRNDTNEIFYIGIGKTIDRSKSKRSRNLYWHNIVNKVGYEIDIICSNVSWKQACKLEKSLIFLYGRKDLNRGPLVNMTDGGDGNVNLSQEARNSISKSLKGRIIPKETLIKRSITAKETWKNPELRELKRLQTNDLIKRGIINQKGRLSKKKGIPVSQEIKNKVSSGLKEYYKNNKPINFKVVDTIVQDEIYTKYKNGNSKYSLHKFYDLNRKIIDRIIKDYENRYSNSIKQ